MRHRGLLVAWGVTYATCASGVVLGLLGVDDLAGLLFGLPIFAAIVLGVVSYFRVRRDDGVLVRPRLYQALVGSLLVTAAVTCVASGSTMVLAAQSPVGVLGLVTLGLLNLAVAILSWQALTRPSPRRAVRAGALAAGLELFAMIPDIMMQIEARGLFGPIDHPRWMAIGIVAAFVAIGVGGLACIASIVGFGPRDASLPAARVVA